ncbi:glycoside hydrolase [Basidiobolus meristosporus CBS 931.73]|uniref:glucan endo-1,3-beta-D-glucosidase n=1 Tax=Basidiobolus meristosporus CBS 931.73 TaxID=1314790 RepID=A0A1Y1XYE8_9FUNG|nr:glycoside hydrolase [Basidiobolus meristosporus CBS 931.73]|eukprot:ORX90752.1 glycoside hydrolase [Basidiobolus meristosporus CBS 931.73]
MVKSGLIYHDEFSASIDYAGRQGASLRAWFVKGTPYQSFYVTQGCPILSTIHAILEVVRFPDNRRLLVRLNNGQHWSIFTEVPVFWEQSGNQLHTTGVFSGYLRLAYVPDDVQQNFHTLTQYSTCVPVGGRVIYEMDLEYLRIQYNFMTYGEGRLLMLTLPHHREVLENPRYIHLPGLSCIKGVMGAIEGNTWFAREPLVKTGWFSGQPIDRKFLDRIEANLEKDVKTHHHSPAPDPYFFGKGVAKMARLALIAEQIGRSELIAEVVGNLKRALEPWLTGGNRNPLVYDLTWKGIVSMQGLGDRGADFGNGWYNDHHYHYGYFIYAIAVVGRYDRGWLDAYRVPILAILKDYANPFHEDPMFPRFRHKDVYDGHSWASGLFEFADARNQESTSEAVNAYYAVYLLGLAWEDRDLQEAGQFLLSTELRSSRVYWQMGESSEIYDPRFKANKCVGIVWGCKVDYVTWFGDLPEYMHCIQYLPFTPITPLLLTPSWIHEQTGILERVLARKDPIVEPKWVAYILMALGIVDKDKASGRMLEVTEFDDGNTATNSWYWLATCGPCQ